LSVNKCKCSHCSNFGENCKNYFNKQFWLWINISKQ
jgi:hypothetical protein